MHVPDAVLRPIAGAQELAVKPIAQVLIAVIAFGTTAYLIVTKQPVPGELWAIDTLILGFYFGATPALRR